MHKPHFQSESTKYEAYRLLHDPTRLFNLLFLKYGDTAEDFNLFFTNQILYNEYSHFNTLYKEHLHNSYEEFIKRFYVYKEIKMRMIKLNNYYKNYLKFFSKPIFVSSFYNKLVNNYYDSKAEIYYMNNLTEKKNSKKIKPTKINNNEYEDSDISSIDNDTENDIIFNQRIKKMIDNNLNTNSCTLTFDINTKNDLNYINKKTISNSFANMVNNFVNYKVNKKDLKSKNIENNNTNKNDEIKQNLKKNENIFEDKIIKENYFINNNRIIIDSKNNEREKIIFHKDKINKIKEPLIQLINNKNIIENSNNKVEQSPENNFNIISQNLAIKMINQKNLNLLRNQEQKIQENKKITKKLFNKKNLCLGLNLYKSPTNKINNINFYSPQNSNDKKNIFNKIFNPINFNKYKINKIQHNSLLSEHFITPGFISVNIENSGKKLYNKKYKLLPKNIKNNIHKIKLHINSGQNNLNILSIKNFQIKSPQNKRNKSTQNLEKANSLTLKDLQHNLSSEKISYINNNGKLALSSITNTNKNKNKIFIENNFYKPINPSLSRNKEEIKKKNNDTYQNFEARNSLNSIIEQIFTKKNQKIKNKYIIEDTKKMGSNTNIKVNKKIYPINFKKFFNKKDNIKEKDIKLGLNFI